MRILVYIFILLSIVAADGAVERMADDRAEEIANAIWRIEGGEKTKYPYGIKSIDTGGDVNKARRICINTIKNNFVRWQRDGKPGFYLDYLADKYCPKSADAQGNTNWKKNMRAIIGKKFF